MINEISFPGLGLNFKISRIAFEFLNIKIYWYAIIIVTGIIIALFLCKLTKNKYNVSFDNIIEALIFALPIGLICARLYYCVFNLNRFIENPLDILKIRDGGIAIYGGLIGALATIYIYCKIKKVEFLNFLDCIVPYVAIAQSIGRFGNFVNVEAFGTETTNILRMRIFLNGSFIEVHPTFLYESIATFLIFLVLTIKKRDFKGEKLIFYLIFYSFARFWIEGLRTDSLMLFNTRISQILSLFIFVVFCFLLIIKKIKSNKKLINKK